MNKWFETSFLKNFFVSSQASSLPCVIYYWWWWKFPESNMLSWHLLILYLPMYIKQLSISIWLLILRNCILLSVGSDNPGNYARKKQHSGWHLIWIYCLVLCPAWEPWVEDMGYISSGLCFLNAFPPGRVAENVRGPASWQRPWVHAVFDGLSS